MAEHIVVANDVALEAIAEFDRSAFPSARKTFLASWLQQPDCVARVAMSSGKIAGYGVIRKCRSSWKIGPLFAMDPLTAEELYLALCGGIGDGQPVYLDVPEVNAEAMALAARYAMRQVFGTARMYTGAAPQIALDRVYGVTTFELG